MQIKKNFVVPVDFSEVSLEAVRTAGRLADDVTEVTLLHVHDVLILSNVDPLCFGAPHSFYHQDFTEQLSGSLWEIRRSELGGVAEVRVKIIVGSSPATVICEFAASRSADLVVLGIGDRGGLSRTLKGSVADDIIRTAPCPVLVVRRGKSGPAATEEKIDIFICNNDAHRSRNFEERHSDLQDALRSFQNFRS